MTSEELHRPNSFKRAEHAQSLIQELFKLGKSTTFIAKELGVNPSTISRIANIDKYPTWTISPSLLNNLEKLVINTHKYNFEKFCEYAGAFSVLAFCNNPSESLHEADRDRLKQAIEASFAKCLNPKNPKVSFPEEISAVLAELATDLYVIKLAPHLDDEGRLRSLIQELEHLSQRLRMQLPESEAG